MNETTDTTEAHALAVFVEGGYDETDFADAYAGTWERDGGGLNRTDLVAYVRDLADELGWYDSMEAAGLNAGWLDVEQIAFDLECGGDVWSADASPGYVHVFRSV